ncbi:MAG TPA: sulfate ABC transporter substrate-binding protein [Planctomycetes bacterium]|nr:sulfate ABC transporter substrate-binding protein [Planctomycetota bacterium]
MFIRTLSLLSILAVASAADLLNVSYDVAREVYKDVNPAFAATPAGAGITVKQSHDGSAKQAQAVINGLSADVVTMNSPSDIDQIAKSGLLAADWATRLPHRSSPSYSTHLLLVRAGNPKAIVDWGDLAKPGVQIVVVNPKTGANGKYTYLAALAWARRQPGANDDTVKDFLRKVYANVLALDKGGRGATSTFAQRGLGDVLVTFESEVFRIEQEFPGKVQRVVPSVSVKADNPVAWIDRNVERKGTAAQAKAYLEFLYTAPAQEIFAKNFIRPSDEAVLAKHAATFAKLDLVTVEEQFGGWSVAQKTHFDDGGWFDQLYQPR